MPRLDGPLLLLETLRHIDAVRNAVRIGDNERRAVVGLSFDERLDRL